MVNSHPVGFRFHPTDEEIIGYYLRAKNMDGNTTHVNEFINTVDIYSFDPWELPSNSSSIRKDYVCPTAHDKKEEELSHQQRKSTTQLKTPTASLTVNSSAFAENKQSMDSTIKLENRFGLLAENDI
ncbi:hypothetical protein F2Q69_00008197 [Brassica cretica]|uniref:NAC domain-containing protein n=1 Tax=Brassica cretica TaxID=69181 RepID=A0A8S9P804_BRACR|nr:hypothetical protein F2Q69_00008197 [Brassica cretica]